MTRVVGTCSQCGGPVVVPVEWFSVVSPLPRCERCGALSVEHGAPVIQTRPARSVRANPQQEVLQ